MVRISIFFSRDVLLTRYLANSSSYLMETELVVDALYSCLVSLWYRAVTSERPSIVSGALTFSCRGTCGLPLHLASDKVWGYGQLLMSIYSAFSRNKGLSKCQKYLSYSPLYTLDAF